jgi:hypothetical protein
MKKLALTLCVVLGFIYPLYSHSEAVVKTVCHDKIDAKTGKPVVGKDGKVVQECKEIKTHKKLEGTAVPTTPPKSSSSSSASSKPATKK